MVGRSPSPPCCAVVVNHDAGPALRRAVASLLESAAVGTVIVVDNASSDDSLAALDDLGAGAGRLVVIRNEDNRGFARACNQALPHRGGGGLLLFNPDCVARPGAIEALAIALDEHPEAGAAGPLLLNPDGTEGPGGRRCAPTPWRSFVRLFGLTRLRSLSPRLFGDYDLEGSPLPEGPVAVDAVSGACMLVRPGALDRVGPLDEGYFLHCEDLDWCERMRQAGLHVLFVPGARVVHDKGLCSRHRPLFVEWHKHRGMLRYYAKFNSGAHPWPLRVLVRGGAWLRLGLVALAATVRLVLGRRGGERG